MHQRAGPVRRTAGTNYGRRPRDGLGYGLPTVPPHGHVLLPDHAGCSGLRALRLGNRGKLMAHVRSTKAPKAE